MCESYTPHTDSMPSTVYTPLPHPVSLARLLAFWLRTQRYVWVCRGIPLSGLSCPHGVHQYRIYYPQSSNHCNTKKDSRNLTTCRHFFTMHVLFLYRMVILGSNTTIDETIQTSRAQPAMAVHARITELYSQHIAAGKLVNAWVAEEDQLPCFVALLSRQTGPF